MGKEPEYRPNDLLAFGEDFYRCTYCPYAEVEDDYTQQRPRVVFKRPCEPAAAMMRMNALERFRVGTRWHRGQAIVDIESVYGDTIESVNTTNRRKRDKGVEYEVYTDTIYYAATSYKELD